MSKWINEIVVFKGDSSLLKEMKSYLQGMKGETLTVSCKGRSKVFVSFEYHADDEEANESVCDFMDKFTVRLQWAYANPDGSMYRLGSDWETPHPVDEF